MILDNACGRVRTTVRNKAYSHILKTVPMPILGEITRGVWDAIGLVTQEMTAILNYEYPDNTYGVMDPYGPR